VICLLVQPIHPAGIEILTEAGMEVRQASATDMATVAAEIATADAAITRNAGLDRHAMAAAPALKVLGNHGIGVDPVDVSYATEIGLPVIYTPYANVQSVAEQAIAMMLAISKRVREADSAVREDRFDYRYSRDFHELNGKTLAVIGFGRIGRRTAELAHSAFAMRIIVYSPHVDSATIEAAGMEKWDDLDAVLREADVVSLHQRLTPDTSGWLDRGRISAMKKGAILINTARGALVDAEALIAAVDSHHLRGAAMDVFEQEPLPVDHAYCRSAGILLSPHIGGATEEAMSRTAVETAQQVVDVLAGRRPEYLVNPEVWERRRA
jgi:D-3-phosphoglycerate dehydrogenase